MNRNALMTTCAVLALASALASADACARDPAEPASTLAPNASNIVLPLFRKPFSGDFGNAQPFDHELPLSFSGDGNDDMLTWWGVRLANIWSGHNGNDWFMPEGTPLLAVADAEVTFAGYETPFLCNNSYETSALIVTLRVTVPTGEVFDARYAHLSRTYVSVGAHVHVGQRIGLSGMTGCATGPHLHFDVGRVMSDGRTVRIDPYGWQGKGSDPWATRPEGATSMWLWKPGQAPDGGQPLEQYFGEAQSAGKTALIGVLFP